MEMSRLLLFLWVSLLFNGGCASLLDPQKIKVPPIKKMRMADVASVVNADLLAVKKPIQRPVIAIYADGFLDHTGARLSNSQFASFSSAITQAPYTYLIRALKNAGSENGGFFDVVERVGLDSVTKERQLIRNTRRDFKNEEKLMPLKFAGLIMSGGVVGYESNTSSGGAGARFLGIGASKEYREDTVVVSLRLISVSTGEVLLEVLTTKAVLSAAVSGDVFRFVSSNTEVVEIEGGAVKNESVNIALQDAIEAAVLEIIRKGIEESYWIMEDSDE